MVATWRLLWRSLVPSALPGASWRPPTGTAGRGSTWLHLVVRCLSSVKPPRPLLLRSPYSPWGPAELSPQAATASPFPRQEEAMEPPPGTGRSPKQPVGWRRKTPGSRRSPPAGGSPRGLPPLAPAREQLPRPSLSYRSPESSKALGPAGWDVFSLTVSLQTQGQAFSTYS